MTSPSSDHKDWMDKCMEVQITPPPLVLPDQVGEHIMGLRRRVHDLQVDLQNERLRQAEIRYEREERERRYMTSELNETEEKMLRMMGLADRLSTLVLGGMDDGIPAPMPADLQSFIKVLNTHLDEAIIRLSTIVDVLVKILPSKPEVSRVDRTLTEAAPPPGVHARGTRGNVRQSHGT